MFQFCNECINHYTNAPSWITPLAQSISAFAAIFVFFVAWKNLRGLKRAQSLQAQMNLINLENDIVINYTKWKLAYYNYTSETEKANPEKLQLVIIEKSSAFEVYVSSADKLAALIGSDFLIGQFENRDWQNEYSVIFKKVQQIHLTEDSIIPGKDQMIRNINQLLTMWAKPKDEKK